MTSQHPFDTLFVIMVISAGAVIGERFQGPWHGILMASTVMVVAYLVWGWWARRKQQ